MNQKGLYWKYFVLKPEGTDIYAQASQKAILEYAKIIEPVNKELALNLRDWINEVKIRIKNK